MTSSRSNETTMALQSAAVLGLAWMGDALIYVVLPPLYDEYGLTLPLVGILLSVNRLVRIAGYGWINQLARRFGGAAMMTAGAVAASATTMTYGLVHGLASSFAILLVARLLWGISFGTMNVLSTVYALGIKTSGKKVGLNRALSTCGPAIGLGLGSLMTVWWGPKIAFLTLGSLGLLAIPLALKLPPLPDQPEEKAAKVKVNRWRPSRLSFLYLTVTMAVDGAFPIALVLLLSQQFSLGSAILTAGLVLALLRVTIVAASIFGGSLIDRFGAGRLLPIALVMLAAGLLAVASGQIILGAIAIIPARALLDVIGPVFVSEQPFGTKVERMAAYLTWVDCGYASGPILAGALIPLIGTDALYLAFLGVLAVGCIVFYQRRFALA